jgi:hypothetical protein
MLEYDLIRAVGLFIIFYSKISICIQFGKL